MNLLTCSKQRHFTANGGEKTKELLTSQIVKAMKLTFILLAAAFLHVSAKSISQNVTLTLKDAPIQKVFREIERQTGLGFLYTKKMLQGTPKVDINVKDAAVSDVLRLCFKDLPLTFTIIEQTIVVKPAIKEEDIITEESLVNDIRGRVVNEKGDPVEGVTVTVKGKTKATSTDANGEFSLRSVDKNATLVFSSVNIESYEVELNGKTDLGTINVKTKVTQGSEIIITTASTGYQQISKERATGSFDVVGRDILDRRPVSNISTALQGLVAGLQAKENLDGTMEFLIRGTSSLYGNKSPLVVVDGFPISGSDFSNINPNDVESVTVLKDAAASSIWGARSANGVIVITTKRPKAGRDKMVVEVNALTRISKMIDLDQVMSQATSADFIRYEKLAYERELFFTTPYSSGFTNIGKPMTLAEELLFANRYGQISTAQMNKSLDSLGQINNRGQIEDQLMRNGIVNQFSVSLSGATERSKTYGSLLYEDKKDGFIKKGYERYLMNFNNQFQATKYLQIVFGANVQYKKTETSGPDVGEIQSISPYETLLNPDGTYSVNLQSWNRAEQSLLPLAKFPYSDWNYNLLREVRGREISSEQISARIQGGLNLRIMKGLDLDVKLQYERIKTENSNYNSEDTWYVRNLVNTYVDYNNNTKVVGTQYLPKGGIGKPSSSNLESYVVRNQLNFNRTFAKKFDVTALAGMEISRYLTTTTTSPWVYGYYPERNQSTFPPYGYGSSVDLFKTFTATTANATLSGGNTTYGWRVDKYASFLGNASVIYDSKYVLSGSIRSDASNYVTDDPKLRWAPLWSVGGMWHMSKEKFMENVNFLDRLSVTLTYGKNGNTETSTSTKPLVSVSTAPSVNTGTITATVADNGNPFLRWEKTTSTNFAIDFSLFKNKLFGKIEVYNKKGTDITGTVLLPAVTGTTSQKFNNAGITNNGLEVELGANINITNKIKFNSSLTYAYNWNNINSLYFPSYLAYQLVDPSTALVEGRPINAIYSYTYLGVTDSVPYVAGPKGVPYTMNAVQLHNTGLGLEFLNYEGTATPPHTLGWVSNFNAYGFNVMVLFVGKFGGVYRNPVFNFPTYVGSAKTNVGRTVEEVFAGDPNIPQFPRYREGQFYLWDRYVPYLEGLVESSSFIECKEIDLEYTLPQKITRKLQMSSLRVFAQIRDVGMVWHANKKGYNPEWLPGTQRPVTAFTFGVNAKF
ncbi:MAG: SusC/RagA family TonB-linked outer membrane protein [Bacteroidota bacterium]